MQGVPPSSGLSPSVPQGQGLDDHQAAALSNNSDSGEEDVSQHSVTQKLPPSPLSQSVAEFLHEDSDDDGSLCEGMEDKAVEEQPRPVFICR